MSTIRKGRVTISEVAEHAGISRAAVYAVLNEHKRVNIRVSEPIRRKVLRVIEELGYIPNDSARTLVSGRSHSIGLILQNDSELARRLCAAVDTVFGRHGFLTIPATSGSSVEWEKEILKRFLGRNVEALIIGRVTPSVNSELLQQYRDFGIPVINISGRAEICFNETRVMELAVEHLAASGMQNIGFLGSRRLLAFSCERRRLNLEEAIARYPGTKFTGVALVDDYESCLRYVENMKQAPDHPDAVICFNDALAELLIHCCNRVGIKVPEELGVVGVDGYPTPYRPMTLTSVKLPAEKMAERIWEVFNNGGNPDTPIQIDPELVIGHSTERNLRK